MDWLLRRVLGPLVEEVEAAAAGEFEGLAVAGEGDFPGGDFVDVHVGGAVHVAANVKTADLDTRDLRGVQRGDFRRAGEALKGGGFRKVALDEDDGFDRGLGQLFARGVFDVHLQRHVVVDLHVPHAVDGDLVVAAHDFFADLDEQPAFFRRESGGGQQGQGKKGDRQEIHTQRLHSEGEGIRGSWGVNSERDSHATSGEENQRVLPLRRNPVHPDNPVNPVSLFLDRINKICRIRGLRSTCEFPDLV